MNTNRPLRDILERTRDFAIETIRFSTTLPTGTESGLIKRQLARAATSVGANYRAACRAKSRRDFVSKLSIVEEEADECIYWLDLLRTLGTDSGELRRLQDEANQIVAIMVASKKTARRKGI